MPLTDPTGTPVANYPVQTLPPADRRADQYVAALGQNQGYFNNLPSYGLGTYGQARTEYTPPPQQEPIPAPPPDPVRPDEGIPDPRADAMNEWLAGAEGRFDNDAYLNAVGNEDLLAASLNDPNWTSGYDHYQRYGRGEGRGLYGEFGLNIGTGEPITQAHIDAFNEQTPNWDINNNGDIDPSEWATWRLGKSNDHYTSGDAATIERQRSTLERGRDSGTLAPDVQARIDFLYDSLYPEGAQTPPLR